MDRRVVGLLVFILFCLGALVSVPTSFAQDPTPTPAADSRLRWKPVELVSGLLRGSWFPQIAVDPLGNVNAVWSVTGEGQTFRELLYFSRWDGLAWSRPVDIKDGGMFIVRSAIAADKEGTLHLVYDDLSTAAYSRAKLEMAGTARGWSDPIPFSGPKQGYIFDMGIDSQGTIHVIYGNSVPQCATCAQLLYRRSFDGGYAWTPPTVLTEFIVDRRRMQLEIDAHDNLYVAWDNMAASGETRSGGFTTSTDGGENWAPPIEFFSPRGAPSQTAVGTDGKGRVIVVYRIGQSDEIDYQVSNDGGRSWGRPQRFQSMFAANEITGFDKYDLTTDSAGTIYLALSARTTQRQQVPGLYVLQWTGESWSEPQPILENPGLFPEYPSLVASQGNQLHLIFHVRGAGRIFELPDETYKVYYTSATTSAPAVEAQPLPTATDTPTAAPSEAPVTPTPTPTRTPFVSRASDTSSSGPVLPQLPIVLAISPVALIIVLLLAWRAYSRRA